MQYERIEEICLAVPDLMTAIEPFRRLGFHVVTTNDNGTTGAYLQVGTIDCMVRLTIWADPLPRQPHIQANADSNPTPYGLTYMTLGVPDLSRAEAELAKRGCGLSNSSNMAVDKSTAWAFLHTDLDAGVPLSLVDRTRSTNESRNPNAFPIRRLDHLAIIATNLEAQTRFWVDVLGVPLFGEVVTPIMIIRQFKIGDAIIELVAPASADSPIHQRKPGLISMVSLEVADLNAAVAQARAAGFTVPDPAKGALPGTLTATIPAAEMSGLALQLLMYI